MHRYPRQCSRLGCGLWLSSGVLLLMMLAGCGYTLAGRPLAATATRHTIAVIPFTNQTREPGLAQYATAALRQTLVYHSPFVLTDASVAPHHLQGIIRRFRTVPLSFDANDNVRQYRLEADIRMRLVEDATQGLRFEQDISAWAEYLVSQTGNIRADVVAREAALMRLAQQFADKCTALLAIRLL